MALDWDATHLWGIGGGRVRTVEWQTALLHSHLPHSEDSVDY